MQKISYLFLILTGLLLSTSCVSRKVYNASKVPKSPAGFKLKKPVGTGYRITQRFRPAKNTKHNGMDIAGKKGSPIFSVGKGRVIYAGSKFSGYGKMILIDHGNGLTTLYSHLTKFFVRSGRRVRAGQLIGSMGRTGRATGVHLHFEVMENKLPVNPEKYIAF